MTREEAKEYIKENVKCTDFLEPSGSGMYCCPVCGSGHNGNRNTGAVKYYENTNTWCCFACTNKKGKHTGGDVIALYMAVNEIGYNEALSSLAEDKGITIDHYTPATAAEDFAEEGEQSNYLSYYRKCREKLTDPAAAAYLQNRGISIDTAREYWLGYDPAADPASAPGGEGQKKHPTPRLILPSSPGHYVGRRIDGGTGFEKINAAGSSPAIFNSKALYAQGVQEVFVLEGVFDALSVIEAGHSAIALNSAGNFERLLSDLEKQRTAATLILCPDNDSDPKTADKVKKQFANLAAGLQRLNIPHVTVDINGSYKDANEHLTGNREEFIEALEVARKQNAARPDNTAFYIDNLMTAEMANFADEKHTGFANLDKEAGGLYAGLYVLAAISSLGKTSFALQLADQIAEAGHDVLFFSMEQSRLELVSKSLARRTVKREGSRLDFNSAVTSLAIRKGYLPKQVIQAAKEYKAAVQDRISIIESNFTADISFIGAYISDYMQKTNSRPVVFIDYLQILQPTEEKRSVKETIDAAITELKKLSRTNNLTVIVISSVNRANYLTPIDFESLKESGNIEYSCDVLWGLQLQCLNSIEFEKAGEKVKIKRGIVKKAKAENPRKIEFVCLKNRYGKANYSCYFDYYPANDLFIEDNTGDFDSEWEGEAWEEV